MKTLKHFGASYTFIKVHTLCPLPIFLGQLNPKKYGLHELLKRRASDIHTLTLNPEGQTKPVVKVPRGHTMNI